MSNKNVVGVDLGGTTVKAARIEGVEILKTIHNVTPASGDDPQAAIDAVIRTIESVLNDSTTAIGIGVPSVVDRKQGIVYDVQNIPSWKEVHLKEILTKRFSLPVFVDNDANCFAIGEKIFGKGNKYQNFVGITLGTGLGAGIINNSRLLDDANCGSGEYGEVAYLDSNYENYCSSAFFNEKIKISGKDLYDLAMKQDKVALEHFCTFGKHLANAIKVVVLTVDPQMIVLGGSISKSFQFFEKAMRDELMNFPYQKSIKNLDIFVSDLENSALYGAAALCY